MILRLLPLVVLVCLAFSSLQAQDGAILSLEAGTTTLQTGQEYEIVVRLENVPEVWLASFEIAYDPAVLYVIGTRSGSPIQQGAFFSPPESTVVVHNSVQENRVVYTISMLAPAAPARGGEVVGRFRVYPLSAGTTQLRFAQADLTTVTFTGEGEQRTGSNPQPVAFTPVLLELTVSGETVQPPSEATATPEPTATTDQGSGVQQPQAEPTLVNVTAGPRTPEPVTAVVEAQEGGTSPALLLAIGAVVVGAVGMLVMVVVSRRRRK